MSKPKKWDIMTTEEQEAWRAMKRRAALKWRKSNLEKARKNFQNWYNLNRDKVSLQYGEKAKKLQPSYVALALRIPISTLKKYPELLEAKREQIKILRELKSTNRKKK